MTASAGEKTGERLRDLSAEARALMEKFPPRPFRPLAYHAARAMFVRANAAVGGGWTLHDLRHTAAYRLARDPAVPITDVQWILGHQSLSTTQVYVTPTAEDVVASVLAHHRRAGPPGPPPPAAGYRPESLDVLFGRGRR